MMEEKIANEIRFNQLERRIIDLETIVSDNINIREELNKRKDETLKSVNLSGVSWKYLDHNLELGESVHTLLLAHCEIDIWDSHSLELVINIVENSPMLKNIDLSYNFLSGKRGFEFIQKLIKIRNDIQINIVGTWR